MSAPKLVLHPERPDAVPPGETLIQALRDLRLIGAGFVLDGLPHFYTGPDFLDGVSFLGCAPSLQLDPPVATAEIEAEARAGRFCHLQVHTATAEPRVRCKTGQPPRCRRCRADIPLQMLHRPGHACPGCGSALTAADVNWRQSGGYARIFLDIWGIHSGEAVPSDPLLNRLGQVGGGPWAFFYLED